MQEPCFNKTDCCKCDYQMHIHMYKAHTTFGSLAASNAGNMQRKKYKCTFNLRQQVACRMVFPPPFNITAVFIFAKINLPSVFKVIRLHKTIF